MGFNIVLLLIIANYEKSLEQCIVLSKDIVKVMFDVLRNKSEG